MRRLKVECVWCSAGGERVCVCLGGGGLMCVLPNPRSMLPTPCSITAGTTHRHQQDIKVDPVPVQEQGMCVRLIGHQAQVPTCVGSCCGVAHAPSCLLALSQAVAGSTGLPAVRASSSFLLAVRAPGQQEQEQQHVILSTNAKLCCESRLCVDGWLMRGILNVRGRVTMHVPAPVRDRQA